MPDLRLLDNPIWNALSTEHAPFACGNGLARCYLPETGPLSGLAEASDAAYEALRGLAGPDGVLCLFLEKPPAVQKGWTIVRRGLMRQMVCERLEFPEAAPMRAGASLRRLSKSDVSAMVELASLTEPGPFRKRTSELGTFFGTFEGDRLVAIAGERMHLPGLIEVSAVCTHPDARSRGYARALMAAVLNDIREKGATPFLHVLAENDAAIRVYEGLGFTVRRPLHLAILKNNP
ncbi:MAG: GNAT family N-acetyltransferase [Terracidiphilus sp.]